MRDTRYPYSPRYGGGSSYSRPGSGYTPRPRQQVFDPLEREFPRNNAITAKEVRVIGAEGENLGVMDCADAIKRAEELEMDLVMIVPQAKPPVCRITTWESFRYQHKKKEKEMRKNTKTIKVKEIKISPKIAGTDFERKVEKIIEIIGKGDQVKITVMRRWPVTEEVARKFKDVLLTKIQDSCTIISIQEKGKNIYILVKSNK